MFLNLFSGHYSSCLIYQTLLFQEKLRFAEPHKAFTYEMHGYQSVMGPVKGVFSKKNDTNRAREHALLISSRPAYITILTLGIIHGFKYIYISVDHRHIGACSFSDSVLACKSRGLWFKFYTGLR